MKRINKILTPVVIALLLFATGCEKTEPVISTADRDKFIGNWHGVSSGPGGTRNFNMTIRASNSAPDQVLMENFDGSGTGTYVNASVTGSTITIISTLISGERYEGSGTLSGTRITFSFTIDDGQTLENRTANADKI